MNAPALHTGFSGIWPALMTPLAASLEVDHPKFAAHAHALLRAGCGGITPFGTTGEGPSFSVAERREAIEGLIRSGIPASRIMVSSSAASVSDVVELTRHAVQIGAHGALIMPPFYFKGVSDQGVIDAYRHVIDSVADSRLRVYLYHIPQVTAVGISHKVISTLQRMYPGTIVGIKDSAGEREHSVGLAAAFGPGLAIYVGNELDLPEMGRLGSRGAISGVSNFMPRTVWQLVGEPDHPTTPAQLERMKGLLDVLFGYSLIPALKAVMRNLSGDDAWLRVRAPLVAMTPEQADSLAHSLLELRLDPARD